MLGESKMFVDNAVLNVVKRVLEEKPIITSLFEVATMTSAVDSRGRPMVKAIVSSGGIGSLVKFNSQLRRVLFTDCYEGRTDDEANTAVSSAYEDVSFLNFISFAMDLQN